MACIKSFEPSEAVQQDCDTRDRRCAHAVGEEDIADAINLFDSASHWFPDISRGSCRACPKNQCHHSTSFFNSTDNSKRRVSTHLFWKVFLGPSSLVTDSLLKASWSRLNSCDHGIRGNGQAKQGAGTKICINPHHYSVPADGSELMAALQVYCDEIGLSLDLPTQADYNCHTVLKLICQAFGHSIEDAALMDVTRRFPDSLSMENGMGSGALPSPGFNFQGMPYGVQQELGNHLVFQALQQQQYQQQQQPLYANGATPPMASQPEVTSPSVSSGTAGYDVYGQQRTQQHSLSEDVDLNLAGSTSYSPTADFWTNTPNFSSSTLEAFNTLVQPAHTALDVGENDVFQTPSSAGFYMTSLPPLNSTSDPSTTTSRIGSLSDAMDLSDEELGQFSKVALGPGFNKHMSSVSYSTPPDVTTSTTTTTAFPFHSYTTSYCLDEDSGSQSSDLSPTLPNARQTRHSQMYATAEAC